MPHLKNRTINGLNLHSTFHHMIDFVGAVFGPIYALNEGMEMYQVLLYTALFFGLRLVLRPFIARLVIKHLGYIRALEIGTVGATLAVACIAMSNGLDYWHLAFVIVMAINGCIYWISFHAYFSHGGENENRGRQISMTFISRTVGKAAITLLGGYVIHHFGYSWYFTLALPLGFGALIALRMCEADSPKWVPFKDNDVPLNTKANIIAGFYNFYIHTIDYMWILFVFLNTDTVVEFAWILFFGVVFKSLILLAQGHFIDKGHANKIHISLLLIGAALLTAMITAPITTLSLLIIEAARSTLAVMMHSNNAPISYNDSTRYKGLYWYWLGHESTWDLGSTLHFVMAAAMLWNGLTIEAMLYPGFFGLIGLWLFLGVNGPSPAQKLFKRPLKPAE